jgi:TolB protein
VLQRWPVLFVSLALMFSLPAARAELTIRITQGEVRGLPIAVVPFGTAVAVPENVAEIISSDLASSGRFAPMKAADMPAQPQTLEQVQFGDWRKFGMENLVVGQIVAEGSGYAIEFRLLDAVKGTQLLGFRAPANNANLRMVAHRIADLIYEQLTGVKGAFATRIAYVLVTRADGKKRYTLQLADSDGASPVTLLSSAQPLLSPAWAPDGKHLAYVSFEGQKSSVYVQELATGSRRVVSSQPGINSAPAWSPDGSRLALTLSKDGDPEIYMLDLASQRLTRLTQDSSIDTEPNWAPDGGSIVFTSDRGGGPQLYRVPTSGGAAQRVTFAQGAYNARPVHAPDGKRIAMVTRVDSAYRIAVASTSGGDFQVLTTSNLDESPTFAPNGQTVMYATTGPNGSELATVSIDGRVRLRLAIPNGEVREPAWGPFQE